MITRWILFLLLSVNAAPAHSVEISFSDWTNLQGQMEVFRPSKKNLLVVLWATWCPDCRSKLKNDLPELANREDLEVVALNTESDSERVRDFVKTEHLPFAVYQDPSRKYRKALQAFSVPHWALYKKSPTGEYRLAATKPAFDRNEIEKWIAQ